MNVLLVNPLGHLQIREVAARLRTSVPMPTSGYLTKKWQHLVLAYVHSKRAEGCHETLGLFTIKSLSKCF